MSMAARQRSDGVWPGLARGAQPPAWLPAGGIERVIRVKRLERLSHAEAAERFCTTVNALKAAIRRHQMKCALTTPADQ